MNRRNFLATAGAGAGALLFSQGAFAGTGPDTDYDARMAWWREARFGMFIHWGVYSVPAGVWKGKRVKNFPAEWIMFAKNIGKDEYAKLPPRFNPVRFNAHEWARIAKNAGMRYMVITSKHHDGFSMYDSKLTDYDIVDATPFKRDPIAELAPACADQGVRFGLYYSELDWKRSVRPYTTQYTPHFDKYMEFMKGQLRELLTNYGPICSLFFDGDWMPQWNRDRGREIESLCRSLQPEVVINNRLDKRPTATNIGVLLGKQEGLKRPEVGDYATPEQAIPEVAPNCDWETCMTMNDSWGYRSWDDNWKPVKTLVQNLVDIASKGGNYLLNVGPTSEGLIPEASVERLAEVGKWMQTNGESIYGTTAGPAVPSWGRATRKPGVIFLHVLEWPGTELTLENFADRIGSAYLLSDPSRRPLPLKRQGANLIVTVPDRPPDQYASVLALKE